jgi:hypothetical protein
MPLNRLYEADAKNPQGTSQAGEGYSEDKRKGGTKAAYSIRLFVSYALAAFAIIPRHAIAAKLPLHCMKL